MDKRDISGKRFGCLVAIKEVEGPPPVRWECVCDCGKTVVRRRYFLVGKGITPKACSRMCPLHGRNKHAAVSTKEYSAWVDMKQRCLNPNNSRYPDYGGRGITVHSAWVNDFTSFLRDVGYAPGQHYSLDRVDNDGDYAPGNIRWAHRVEQQGNRRNTVFVEYRGKRLTLTEMSAITGVPRKTLYSRLISGAADITKDQPLGPKRKNRDV